jgi:CubicO group peptidase (beta-lactamase class C family)
MGEKDAFSTDIVDAKKVGLDPDRLQRLKQAIEEDTTQGMYDGAVFIVARHGKVALYEAVGKTDLEKDRQAKLDDIFLVMSVTKKLTGVRVLMDVERGKFTLNTPVCEVIPEFGTKGKQNVTVYHILNHTSGLNTEIPFGLPIDQLANIEGVTAAMSNERLFILPGTMVTYNAVTSFSLLAVMVQRLDERDRPFRQIMAEDLFGPLGMTDTALGLPDRFRDRIVPLAVRDRSPGLFEPVLMEAINLMMTEETEAPAGGAVSTAADIFRFAEMLRRGGELNGTRILSPGMVKMATTNHTGDLPNHIFDYAREMHGWPVWPAYLGLSFFVRGEGTFPTYLGVNTSPGTFAGLGAGSTMFWVDPERDLTFVLLTAGLLEEKNNTMRHQRLSDLVVAAATD